MSKERICQNLILYFWVFEHDSWPIMFTGFHQRFTLKYSGASDLAAMPWNVQQCVELNYIGP